MPKFKKGEVCEAHSNGKYIPEGWHECTILRVPGDADGHPAWYVIDVRGFPVAPAIRLFFKGWLAKENRLRKKRPPADYSAEVREWFREVTEGYRLPDKVS